MEVRSLPCSDSAVVVGDDFNSASSSTPIEYPLLPFFGQVKTTQHLTIKGVLPSSPQHSRLEQPISSSSVLHPQPKPTAFITRNCQGRYGPQRVLQTELASLVQFAGDQPEITARISFRVGDFATLSSNLSDRDIALFRVLPNHRREPFDCIIPLTQPLGSEAQPRLQLLEETILVSGILFDVEINFSPSGAPYRTRFVLGWSASYLFQVLGANAQVPSAYFYFLNSNRDHAPAKICTGQELANQWQSPNEKSQPDAKMFKMKRIEAAQNFSKQQFEFHRLWRHTLSLASEKSFRQRLMQRTTGKRCSREASREIRPADEEKPFKKQVIASDSSTIVAATPTSRYLLAFQALKKTFDLLMKETMPLTVDHAKPKIIVEDELPSAAERTAKATRFTQCQTDLLQRYQHFSTKFLLLENSTAFDLWLDGFSADLYKSYAAVRDHPELQSAEQKVFSMPMLPLFERIIEQIDTFPSLVRFVNIGLIAFAVGQIIQFHASNPVQSEKYLRLALHILTHHEGASVKMDIARIDSALGNAYRSTDVAKSVHHLRRAVTAQLEEHGDSDHWEVANARIGLSKTLIQFRKLSNERPDDLLQEAWGMLSRGIDVFTKLKHPRLGWAKLGLVSFYAANEDYETALLGIPKKIDDRFPMFLHMAKLLAALSKYSEAREYCIKSESQYNDLQLSSDHRYRTQLKETSLQIEIEDFHKMSSLLSSGEACP